MNLLDTLSLALDTLQYHTEQTRPIDKTEKAITNLRLAIAELEKAELDRSDAYDLIDRQLRNTLDDDYYAEFSSCLDLLYTHPAPAVPEGWQPIDTAPKGGSYILLGNQYGQWIGMYREVNQSGFKPVNPWRSMMLNHDHMDVATVIPTHWMPLPAAPKGTP